MYKLIGCEEAFAVEVELTVQSISPSQGSADGDGTVTVHGTGFTAGGALGVMVYFGDKKARLLLFDGDEKIVVVAPPGEAGQTVDVQLIFDDGREHKLSRAYTYATSQQ